MYLRTVHAEHHIPTLHDFIRANPLGIFTTAIDSSSHPLIQSSHIPWILDVQDETSETELGVLRGHMARANPQSKAIIENLTSSPSKASSPSAPQTLEKDVLILFNAPAHHYVTPKFYKETKPSTGKVVPTWDYMAVQVYGQATIYFDTGAESAAFLTKQLADLSQYSEMQIMGYERPWQVGDAPASYVALLQKAIVGIEVRITDMGGKWKMSQELSQGDREGVVEGFKSLGSEVALQIAKVVRERAPLTDAKEE